MPAEPTANRCVGCSCRAAARSRGVVMVITLLALILIAAILFYVLNLGRQAQSRVETQNAADASAAAGAGWVARSFNTVAMNNVNTARLIALANVMDAMPRATASAHKDQAAVLRAVDGQLARGVSGRWVREGLERFRDEIEAEVRELAPMDRFFNDSGYDVRRLTYYNGPNGMGELWRAMHAMDGTSQAMMENLAVLAQVNAIHGGEINLTPGSSASGSPGSPGTSASGGEGTSRGGESSGGGAFLVPVLTDIPWKRGGFDDFYRPVMHGLLPRDTDDKEFNRGPYDVLFGYRDLIESDIRGYRLGNTDVAGDGAGSVPIGRGPDRDPFIETGFRARGYGVYGPLTRMRIALAHHALPHLPHSRFIDYSLILPYGSSAPPNTYWVDTLAGIKLGYMWDRKPVERMVEPRYQTSFVQAIGIAESDSQRIKETVFVAVEIKSRYPSDHPRFLSPGSWTYVMEEEPYLRSSPRIIWTRGWTDPRDWGVPQVGSYVWRDEWSYNVYSDTQLGIGQSPDGDGNPRPQPVYRIDDYVFVGVNIGEWADVRNPHNFDSKSDLPAPIDLDHELLTRDPEARRRWLTFLAVAHRSNRAMVWPSGFDGQRPDPNNVAITEATVFNNHSWDLWTQMWQSQVQRVEGYDQWVAWLEATSPGASQIPDLEVSDLATIKKRLRDAEPLAPVMLHH